MFIVIIVKFFVSFSVSLFVLIILGQFGPLFRGFENIQKSKMADPQWRLCRTNYAIPTSYEAIITLCGPQRKWLWMYHVPSRFHCHSFNALEVTGEGGGAMCPPHPPNQGLGTKKNSPDKIGLKLRDYSRLYNKQNNTWLFRDILCIIEHVI